MINNNSDNDIIHVITTHININSNKFEINTGGGQRPCCDPHEAAGGDGVCERGPEALII